MKSAHLTKLAPIHAQVLRRRVLQRSIYLWALMSSFSLQMRPCPEMVAHRSNLNTTSQQVWWVVEIKLHLGLLEGSMSTLLFRQAYSQFELPHLPQQLPLPLPLPLPFALLVASLEDYIFDHFLQEDDTVFNLLQKPLCCKKTYKCFITVFVKHYLLNLEHFHIPRPPSTDLWFPLITVWWTQKSNKNLAKERRPRRWRGSL